jgi:hypothetical protein
MVLLPTVLQCRVWKLAYSLISVVSKSIDFNKYGWTTPASPLLYYDIHTEISAIFQWRCSRNLPMARQLAVYSIPNLL